MFNTAPYDFDTLIERRDSGCIKWNAYDPDVLPLWVAEMDFQCAPQILNAIKERVDHGIFGYTAAPESLKQVIVERMKALYQWEITPEDVLFNPGMVVTLNLAAQAVGKAGDGIIMNTPVYGPFLSVAPHRERFPQMVDMRRVDDDAHTFHYEIDFEAFEKAITPQTSLYFLCDPHNPGGRAFRRDELEKLAEICLKHKIVICADAIHADLMMGDHKHIPMATISPEIADQTITLIAPTKTFNMPGLPCSIAIITNKELREKVATISQRSGYHVDVLAYTASLAAYQHGGDWLKQTLAYLTENRDFLVKTIRENIPQIKTTVPEATYLAWFDVSQLPLDGRYANAQEFLVKEAKVALNAGTFFGSVGAPYVRLNYATPRPVLAEAMQRIQAAIERL